MKTICRFLPIFLAFIFISCSNDDTSDEIIDSPPVYLNYVISTKNYKLDGKVKTLIYSENPGAILQTDSLPTEKLKNYFFIRDIYDFDTNGVLKSIITIVDGRRYIDTVTFKYDDKYRLIEYNQISEHTTISYNDIEKTATRAIYRFGVLHKETVHPLDVNGYVALDQIIDHLDSYFDSYFSTNGPNGSTKALDHRNDSKFKMKIDSKGNWVERYYIYWVYSPNDTKAPFPYCDFYSYHTQKIEYYDGPASGDLIDIIEDIKK